MELNKKQKNRS